MKKTPQSRIKPGANRIEPNIEIFMSKIEQHMIHLERKLDVVIAQNSAKPKETPSSFMRADSQGQSHQHQPGQQNNPPRERVMYKAVCADCGNGCEVPFKPSAERPVYCKECFGKRKAGGNRNNVPQRTPEEVQKVLGGLKTSDFQKIAKGKPIKLKKVKPGKKAKKK